jgi:hypothetical protein
LEAKLNKLHCLVLTLCLLEGASIRGQAAETEQDLKTKLYSSCGDGYSDPNEPPSCWNQAATNMANQVSEHNACSTLRKLFDHWAPKIMSPGETNETQTHALSVVITIEVNYFPACIKESINRLIDESSAKLLPFSLAQEVPVELLYRSFEHAKKHMALQTTERRFSEFKEVIRKGFANLMKIQAQSPSEEEWDKAIQNYTSAKLNATVPVVQYQMKLQKYFEDKWFHGHSMLRSEFLSQVRRLAGLLVVEVAQRWQPYIQNHKNSDPPVDIPDDPQLEEYLAAIRVFDI